MFEVCLPGCILLSELDLRFNRPLRAEWLRGERLYRQVREKTPTPWPLPESMFEQENTAESAEQKWIAPLEEEEAASVAGYTRREARWLDVDTADPARAATDMGEVQYCLLRRFERAFSSAVSKSLTGAMVVRHYVRGLPVQNPGEPGLQGRIYVLSDYTSCSLADRSSPGYGKCEVQIALPPAAGVGVFVSPPGVCTSESELVLTPGTTLRIIGKKGRVLRTERVRPMSVSWNTPAVRSRRYTPCDCGVYDEYNAELLSGFRDNVPAGILPATAPAPTAGW